MWQEHRCGERTGLRLGRWFGAEPDPATLRLLVLSIANREPAVDIQNIHRLHFRMMSVLRFRECIKEDVIHEETLRSQRNTDGGRGFGEEAGFNYLWM